MRSDVTGGYLHLICIHVTSARFHENANMDLQSDVTGGHLQVIHISFAHAAQSGCFHKCAKDAHVDMRSDVTGGHLHLICMHVTSVRIHDNACGYAE